MLRDKAELQHPLREYDADMVARWVRWAARSDRLACLGASWELILAAEQLGICPRLTSGLGDHADPPFVAGCGIFTCTSGLTQWQHSTELSMRVCVVGSTLLSPETVPSCCAQTPDPLMSAPACPCSLQVMAAFRIQTVGERRLLMPALCCHGGRLAASNHCAG